MTWCLGALKLLLFLAQDFVFLHSDVVEDGRISKMELPPGSGGNQAGDLGTKLLQRGTSARRCCRVKRGSRMPLGEGI